MYVNLIAIEQLNVLVYSCPGDAYNLFGVHHVVDTIRSLYNKVISGVYMQGSDFGVRYNDLGISS